jgi:hypothetical protein
MNNISNLNYSNREQDFLKYNLEKIKSDLGEIIWDLGQIKLLFVFSYVRLI